MPYDFPANPVDGQVYDVFVYSALKSGWVSADSVEALETRVNNVERLVPPGSIHQFAGGQAPTGYLFCQGQAISRSEYARLFSAISTTYGTGDGSTTFNIPNLQGRVPVGKAASGTFLNLGAIGGAETVTLTEAQMPSHTHIQNPHTHTQDAHTHTIRSNDGGNGPWTINKTANGSAYYVLAADYVTNNANVVYNDSVAATNQNTTATNQNTGGGGAHNNLQPYNTVNYIIKF